MSRPEVEIIPELCKGCTLCVKACPFAAIGMREGKAVIDYDACTLCGACVSICKQFGAIVSHTGEGVVQRPHRGDVWVFCETLSSGKLARSSAELLGKARDLAAALEVSVGAVLIGSDLADAAGEAICYGADTVYSASSPSLDKFVDEPYAVLTCKAAREYQPQILLGAATAVGRAVLPRAAILLDTGLTADCTELTIDPETKLLLQTRPAFGGNIMATIQCRDKRPQMATVRPGVLPAPEPHRERAGKVVDLPVADADLSTGLRWLESRFKGEGTGGLRDADLIVTAGAGVGGVDGVRLVEKLAEELGGVLGASRAAVDAGWVPYAHQVGQTGMTVQPAVYIACGVSGAIQHIVGMQNSTTIVAINRDSEAPIFNYADVGIVGDVLEVVPALLRQLNSPQ